MKLSTYLSALLLLFLYMPLQAQNNDINESDWREWTRGAKMVKTTGPNEKIEGTPYFNPEWTKGRALLRSNNKTNEILLRYNANTNELEFKKDGEILIAIPRMVTAFTLQNEDNEKVSFKSGFKSRENDIYPGLFLRVIHDGKVKLVAHHKTEFMKAHSINPLTGKKVSKYIPKVDHFLITEDGKFHDIKLKRKHILRAIDKHEDELKNFAKSNGLDFGNENNLARILAHYDNL